MQTIRNIKDHIKKSINLKIILVTTICLILFLIAILSMIYKGTGRLKDETLIVAQTELEKLTTDYYNNYIDAVDVYIDSEIEGIFDELHILSNTLQTFFSNRSELDEFVEGMNSSEFFDDRLIQSDNYYQNNNTEPSAVFVASYMIDDNGVINESAMSLIEDTKILDLIIPSFSTYGIAKVQAYFQGGENSEIFRLAPWSDIGGNVVDVYPEIFDEPIWEAFNPGLAGEWREWIKSVDSPEALTDMLRVTPPVQDGLTGELVLTFSQPLANEDLTDFMGTISYDVPIGNIVSMVEEIAISESGFAFVTQENGNVFAINDQGLETFGLQSDTESTTDSEIGFNPLERFLAKSSHESIRTLEINNGEEAVINIITIGKDEYILATKNLITYQSWSPERGFFDETWQIGFVVPYAEVYGMYTELENNINREMNQINMNTIIMTIVVALVLLILIYKFNTMFTSELVKLSHVVNEAKSKKYDVVIDIDSDDEVGVLATAFKDMLGEIKDSFSKLEEQNTALKNEINQRKQKDRIIDYLENFDSGTDLPNKKALLNILKDVHSETDSFVSLVVIGLDEFRKVNEAYSWTFGDKLMMKISERLRTLLPKDSLLFKLSGDEFAFIIKENKFKNLISIIEDVSAAFVKAFYVENHDVTIGSSIGISSYPYDSDDPLDIFKFASNAMVHAKEVNRGKYEFYNAEINSTARMRMEMTNELRNAIEQEELTLNYQPIVLTDTQEVSGMEVLLRWHSKSLGNIPPNVFIPLAEKTKLILPIGDWVLKRALEDTKLLHDSGHAHLVVAINVSIIQFLDDNFVDRLKKHISNTGIDPTKITIEITEGLFINDLDKIMAVLNHVRNLGLSISVDDFGTGYSSLSYIKNLPLSKLKIDRSFIREIEDERSFKLVSGIIDLAKNMNLTVVAEGIETTEQLKIIQSKACKESQGYLFSKPLTFGKFKDFISQK